MADLKTIDNLGPGASNNWAQQQESVDKNLLSEGRAIQSQTQISVIEPTYLSELSVVVGRPLQYQPLANFSFPPYYKEQKNNLFTNQLCPRLGSREKKEEQIQRIEQIVPGLPDGTKPLNKEKEEEQREKNVLSDLLNLNIEYDEYSADFYGRRDQYYRG